MSVSTIPYEFEGVELELAPSQGYFRGYLTATAGDPSETFGMDVNLKNIKARAQFVEGARELFPEAFDEGTLKKALNYFAVTLGEMQAAAALAQAKAEEADDNVDDHDANVDDAEIVAKISESGVLNRYVEDMAAVHEVYGDRNEMKVVALGALSAQLTPPVTDKPIGTNVVLIGEPGRGKNYISDAVASGMPASFVYEFESASAKSFYYEAQQDPNRFTHTWVYPNEAEATDALVETLRPLLSKGKASHKTVDRNDGGVNEFKGLDIRGPITATIPTVRNKLDTQLQTRMLVMELEEFENRVSEHSAKVSETLLAEYVAQDHEGVLKVWRAALSRLTGVRRVIIPTGHPDFRLTNEKVSHGARLWRNFLSLMLTNAWLEQRNREIRTLPNGERAVVAEAEDYRTAYEIFFATCGRSVSNVGATHRKILDAVYELEQGPKGRLRDKGFSLRDIGEKAGISHQAVKNHKAYLTQSLGYLTEPDSGGLRLAPGLDKSAWAEKGLLEGYPKPEDVTEWWSTQNRVYKIDSSVNHTENPIDTPDQASTEGVYKEVYMSTPVSTPEVYTEKTIDKPNPNGKGEVSTSSTSSEAPEKTEKPEGELDLDFEYIDEE
jgi:hypothetical protein